MQLRLNLSRFNLEHFVPLHNFVSSSNEYDQYPDLNLTNWLLVFKTAKTNFKIYTF